MDWAGAWSTSTQVDEICFTRSPCCQRWEYAYSVVYERSPNQGSYWDRNSTEPRRGSKLSFLPAVASCSRFLLRHKEKHRPGQSSRSNDTSDSSHNASRWLETRCTVSSDVEAGRLGGPGVRPRSSPTHCSLCAWEARQRPRRVFAASQGRRQNCGLRASDCLFPLVAHMVWSTVSTDSPAVSASFNYKSTIPW